MINRDYLADLIASRLQQDHEELTVSFARSGNIRVCTIDNLFPEQVADALYNDFPDPSDTSLVYKSSLRERKFSTNQLCALPPSLRNAVLAFEDHRIIQLIQKITGFTALMKDQHMYAGGVSEMSKGHFVLPHTDNSHDFHRQNYRALNLLYYLAKEWKKSHGGNLELWPEGLESEKIELVSKFNRLVIMETPPHAWHAVNELKVDHPRRAIFYTYFQKEPLADFHYFNVTSTRARPGNHFMNLVLHIDIKLRMLLRRIFPRGIKGERVIWDRKKRR